MRYYDQQQNRLIYFSQRATADYWDEHWETGDALRKRLQNSRETYISRITKRHLQPQDGPILEGGCGTGQHVAALSHQGYECIGVDYAEKTVQAIQQAAPDLDVQLGDITQLQFADGAFAGYWSVGVIEHFWDGYAPCAAEMARVLRPGGYLFLTFPQMSILRRWKARLHGYERWQNQASTDAFYQFALDHRRVRADFLPHGFEPVAAVALDGLKGLKDELRWFKRPLQRLYNYRGRSIVVRGLRLMLTRALAPITGHSMLLVLRRTHQPSPAATQQDAAS